MKMQISSFWTHTSEVEEPWKFLRRSKAGRIDEENDRLLGMRLENTPLLISPQFVLNLETEEGKNNASGNANEMRH
jgi:hypothetical protein